MGVEVRGLSGRISDELARRGDGGWMEWAKTLSVRLVSSNGGTNDWLPMAGSYRAIPGGLRFDARFGLSPGLTYEAVFHPSRLPEARGDEPPLVSRHTPLIRRASSTTRLTQVYPTAAVLPENLLKFYLQFSAPMSRGRIYQHIHLRRANGGEVELPFLEINEELWDPSMTRLTLFIDPGRIKRGVRPLEEIGPALEEGKIYTLTIDSQWRDANDAPLESAFRKRFRVGPPDRDTPDMSLWRVDAPRAGTRGKLKVSFNDPLDHALAQRMIFVRDREGARLEGAIELSDHERRWTFIPRKPWRAGEHTLVAATTIEDLAGNNIDKPFDVDVFDSVQRRIGANEATRRFEVR